MNCGAETTGRFCPDCGQSMATRRFTMRSLGLHMVSALTRVSGDFLRTSWGLLSRPWIVVRDYIYGKRVGLVSPVSMLLLLALYWGLLTALMPSLSQAGKLEAMNLGGLLKWLYGSLTFQYLFLTVPIALGTWAVYCRDMRGRFNFAELTIAALYLACTFLLVDFILIPLELADSTLANVIVVAATAVYGTVSILKAFPQKSKGRSALKISLWGLVCGALLFVFLMLFALPMYR